MGTRQSGSNCLLSLQSILTLLALTLCGQNAPTQAPRAVDLVEELRQTLRLPARDPVERATAIKRDVDRLRTFNDLRRALSLLEWRDEDPDDAIAASDRAGRSAVSKRFGDALRGVLQKGDITARLAAVNVLAEMGPKVRGVRTRAAFTREFAPDLARLMQQEDRRLREAAARALGLILPEPAMACQALGARLAAAEVSERQAAAEGLVNLLRTAHQLAGRGRGAGSVEVTRGELVATGRAVMATAGRGAGDEAAEVRRPSVEALVLAAALLGKLVPDARATEGIDAETQHKQIQEDLEALRPMIAVFKDQGTVLTRALNDSDTYVRLAARRAVEEGDAAATRLRALRQLATTLAAVADGQPGTRIERSKLDVDELPAEASHERVLALAEGLLDRDARARRAAIDVLETLGPAAAPAAPALVKALGDSDCFVRWSAARALGKTGGAHAAIAVPALARLLEDSDLNVRRAAATALDRYGPAAYPALTALIRTLAVEDGDLRVTVIRAMRGIGGDAEPAVPALIKVLADREARVRLAAVETMAKLGPAAKDAADELRKLLRDEDAEVRRAASAALVTVAEAAKK